MSDTPASPPTSPGAEGTLPSEAPETLLLTETYASVQGESTYAGLPFVLVRLARCNLRCVWCDSAFTFRGGERRALEDVLRQTLAHGLKHVLVTGGEPLLQPEAFTLMRRLCDAGQTVLVETGGSIDIRDVDPRVHRIVDVKCPASGESARNRMDNLAQLTERDEVKFVIADRADYEFARDLIASERLAERCATVLISPVHGDAELPRLIAQWLVEDRSAARLQLQLHKFIWPPSERRR